jgi:hypothetical protein
MLKLLFKLGFKSFSLVCLALDCIHQRTQQQWHCAGCRFEVDADKRRARVEFAHVGTPAGCADDGQVIGTVRQQSDQCDATEKKEREVTKGADNKGDSDEEDSGGEWQRK